MAYQTHHTQQQSQQAWDQAIGTIIAQISQQENIQTVDQAIESLNMTGGRYAAPSVHALYLQKVPESKGFTRKDVSIYLAELGEDDETLQTYFQLVHFGGQTIEGSLRLFYTQLRLEPLMNKNNLNVLLTGLATAFKTNGGSFEGDIEDCVRIYNAMIMLNDSLHNKNALGRSRQTEKGFLQIINDRKANKVNAFDEDEMRRIFHSIQSCALGQIKGKHVAMASQPVTPAELANASAKPQSYSKYGPSQGQADVVHHGSMMKKGYGDNDINPEQPQGGGCCVVL
eukprot:223899_1